MTELLKLLVSVAFVVLALISFIKAVLVIGTPAETFGTTYLLASVASLALWPLFLRLIK